MQRIYSRKIQCRSVAKSKPLSFTPVAPSRIPVKKIVATCNPSNIEKPKPKKEKKRFPLIEAKKRLLFSWTGWEETEFFEAIAIFMQDHTDNSATAAKKLMQLAKKHVGATPLGLSPKTNSVLVPKICVSKAVNAAFSALFGWKDEEVKAALSLLGTTDELIETTDILLTLCVAEHAPEFQTLHPLAIVQKHKIGVNHV